MMIDEVRTARLIRGARRGSEDAFRELLEIHRQAITSTLYACGVRTEETARDLAQETALRAWMRLGSLRDSRSFSPWIRQIAANAARDHLRRRAVRREDDLEEAAQLAGPEDPERDAQHRSELRQMLAALAMEDEQDVELVLDRARGVPMREIADRWGATEAALKMRLMRIRKRLRRRLSESHRWD
jgi:RNA polymerase sigma-70 factor (ECF subfamily)